MKTKSRAVRRNSCGYGLQDDVGVSGGAAVNDGRSPTPVLEDFGSGVSVSLQEDSVSGDAIIRGMDLGLALMWTGPWVAIVVPVVPLTRLLESREG